MFSRTRNACFSPKLRFKRFKPILFLFGLCVFQLGVAQYEASDGMHRSRFGIQYGHGTNEMPWTNLDIAYHYEVNLLQLQYYYAIKNGKTFACDLLLAPQYNTTNYRKVDQVGELYNGYELGFTAGFSPRLNMVKGTLGLYVLITSGPMYISGTPGRQAEGFNFSSTAATGVQLRLLKKTYIDLRTGIRHLSNAGTERPNGGVNNLVWSLGVNYGL